MGRYQAGIQTEARIIDATRTLLAERGLEGTTLKAICELAEVRAGSFYNLFVRGSGDQSLIIHMTNDRDVSGLSPGNPVRIGFRASDCVALPSGEQATD